MEHINKTFLRALFYEKKVAINQSQFKALHQVIFPCADLFEKFLLSDNEEEQKEKTKQIIQNLLFQSKAYPCPEILESLIKAESDYPASNEKSFIPQDHVIHSLNVYILGIFLYFNHQLLHDRLNDFFDDIDRYDTDSSPIAETLHFIEAWKVFSLYHDLGYPFERLISTEKTTDTVNPLLVYENLASYLEFDEAVRSLAVAILVTCICMRSRKKLNSYLDKHGIVLAKWESIGYHSGNHEIDKAKIEEWKNYVKLYCVFSPQDAKTLYPFISFDDLLFVVKNNRGNEYFIITKIEGEYVCLKRPNTSAPNINILTYPTDEFEFEVFCNNPCDLLQSKATTYRFPELKESDWPEIAAFFGESYITKATKRFYTCEDALVDIYRELRKEYKFDYTTLEYDEIKESKFADRKQLKECLIKDITEIIDNNEDSDEELEITLSNITQQINRKLSDKTYQELVLNKLVQIENKENSRLQILYQVFSPTHYCLRAPSSKVITRKPNVFYKKKKGKKDKYIINCVPFAVSFYDNCQIFNKTYSDILKQITDNLTDMRIVDNDISPIQRYSPKWNAYDHGIMSAHISLFVMAWRAQCNTSPFLKISQENKDSCLQDLCKERLAAEAISAIVSHNIYISRYCSLGNNAYTLSLDNHPLAFFGALCDSLQIWNRKHNADQSRITLKDFNPTHHHVMIDIRRNDIVLTIETDNPKKTGQVQRANLDQYLKGASPMVKINLIEASTQE